MTSLALKLNPLALYHHWARRAVAALSLLIVLCAFLYGFFLLGAVSHAASHAEIRREVAQLASKVGTLQTTYLKETRALTPERAQALGFVEPAAVATVYAEAPETLSANR